MKRKSIVLLLLTQISLFADFAPESGVGIAARVNISSGTGFLASTGEAFFVTNLSGNDYRLIWGENIADEYGTYQWNKIDEYQVSLTLFNAVLGLNVTYFMTYTSEDGGTFTASELSVGTQTGSFEMYYILKPSAVSSSLAMGQPVVKVEQDQVNIELQMKSSAGLSSFTPQNGTVSTDGNGKITFTAPVNADSKFYRIEVLSGKK